MVTYLSESIQGTTGIIVLPPPNPSNIDPSKIIINRDLVSVQVTPTSFLNTLRLTVILSEGAIPVANAPTLFIISDVFIEHPFTDYLQQQNVTVTSSDNFHIVPTMTGSFIFNQAGVGPNNIMFSIFRPVILLDTSAIFSTMTFNYFSNA